jgi:hypothetical protein
MWMDGWTGRHGEAVVALCGFANIPVRLAYMEVYTVHYFLEDLCKHSSFFKTGHPWNKGQLNVFLRTSEPRLAFDKCKLSLPVLFC